jgi:hypothetical protein
MMAVEFIMLADNDDAALRFGADADLPQALRNAQPPSAFLHGRQRMSRRRHVRHRSLC